MTPARMSSKRSTAIISRRAPTRSRRNTFGCNLVNLGDYHIPDKIHELSPKGTAIAKRVWGRGDEMGVQTSIR
jgi:hypothetical protein